MTTIVNKLTVKEVRDLGYELPDSFPDDSRIDIDNLPNLNAEIVNLHLNSTTITPTIEKPQ